MKKIIFIIVVVCCYTSIYAQESIFTNPLTTDSLIQVWGQVSRADSINIPVEMAIIEVTNQNRGTFTTNKGAFSLVVFPGDELTISRLGYKTLHITIPRNFKGNYYEVFARMEIDKVELPTVTVKSHPTPEQFKRDLLYTDFPDDPITIAQKNINRKTIRDYLKYMPRDAFETINYMLKTQANTYYYYGQLPPMPIFDPLAWARFIEAWKSGALSD